MYAFLVVLFLVLFKTHQLGVMTQPKSGMIYSCIHSHLLADLSRKWGHRQCCLLGESMTLE